MGLLDQLGKKSQDHFHRFIAMQPKFEASLRSATFPNYTPHDIRHSKKIEEIVNRLLPEPFIEDMNEEEIFILLYSIYMHDVGMSEDARPKREGSEYQDDYLDRCRRIHSARSENFILSNYREFGLSLAQAGITGRICKAHSDVKEKNKKRIHTFIDLINDNAVENIGIKTIRIHLLAALLRISDELDIDITRAEARLESIKGYPEESRAEWLKHLMVRGIEIRHLDWSIELDVAVEMLTQSELESSDKENLSKADNNRYVTDVSVKLRAALAEVAPILNRYGLGYRTIEFRDKLVQKLKRELVYFNIPNFGTTALKPSYDHSNNELDYQEYLLSVERIPLSPELRIAPYLDERLQVSSDFLDLIYKGSYSPTHQSIIINTVNTLLSRELEDCESNALSRGKLDSLETYREAIDTLAAFMIQGGINNIQFNITKWTNRINKMLNKRSLFESPIDIADDVTKRLGRDIFRAARRLALKEKLRDHYFIEVFPISFLDSFLGEAERETDECKRYIGECYAETLKNLKSFLSILSFQLYCRTDKIGVDYAIIAAELLIFSGTRTRLTSADTASLGPFYSDAWALVNAPNTYRISSIDLKNGKFRLDKKERDPSVLELETQLNELSSRLLNLTRKEKPEQKNLFTSEKNGEEKT
ncbi:MAG: hypothetical protein ACM3SY_13275 [Candidatus Omnitrophota bacterium]